MIDDEFAAELCRLQAQNWRTQAEMSGEQTARKAALRLAQDYEWRAASLEAAMSMRARENWTLTNTEIPAPTEAA